LNVGEKSMLLRISCEEKPVGLDILSNDIIEVQIMGVKCAGRIRRTYVFDDLRNRRRY
jgi:hypothetical protein